MLDQKTLDDVIRRVAGVARPEKIILFGSAARGATGPDSDIDLLIIVKRARTSSISWPDLQETARGWCSG